MANKDIMFSWNEIKFKKYDDYYSNLLSYTEENLSSTDIDFLLSFLMVEENINKLNEMSKFEDLQLEYGAWVKNIFPSISEILQDKISINDEKDLLKFLYNIAKLKKEYMTAVSSFGNFPVNFSKKEYETKPFLKYPLGWKLDADTSVLNETINFITGNNKDIEAAIKIAELRPNIEMLKHRNNLGYLPEPITNVYSLAKLLLWAQSKDPIDMFWKWLNPLNIFDFSDIFMNSSDYSNLHNHINLNWSNMKSQILGTIYKVMPIDIEFNEIFALTIGFGIRGWATNSMFGVNIENIKDNYDLLLAVIAHELTHRIQLKICPANANDTTDNRTFDDITKASLKNPKNEKFYECLTYIMLEGTGEYIKHQFVGNQVDDNQIIKAAKNGIELLNNIYEVIYINSDFDKAEQLLNKGLKSNGSFYSLGELMTIDLLSHYGSNKLGELLKNGSINFFLDFLNINPGKFSQDIHFKDTILELEAIQKCPRIR